MTDETGILAELMSEIGTYDLWSDLSERIGKRQVVPIISNSVINNRIFDVDADGHLSISRDFQVYSFTFDQRYRFSRSSTSNTRLILPIRCFSNSSSDVFLFLMKEI